MTTLRDLLRDLITCPDCGGRLHGFSKVGDRLIYAEDRLRCENCKKRWNAGYVIGWRDAKLGDRPVTWLPHRRRY